MANENIKGKVAVVTGAGGTLCSEMARELASKGYQVALLGRTLAKLEQVETGITAAGGCAMSVVADVSSEDAIRQAHEKVKKALGPCSLLINGAGGNQTEAITTANQFVQEELSDSTECRGFFNLDMDAFQSVLKINTMGTVIPCHVFGKDMAENGGGCIINIASMNSYRPLSRVAAYGMAKAGIVNFTQWLAAYLAPVGIRVNAIAPGFFLNERSRKRLLNPDGSFSERGQSVIDHTPLAQFGEARQLIGCMNWLVDDQASDFVTGITIPVDGGFLACSGI
jgi:NAD(P)-dependent dehydrogenase (short-subunit alcohol dehydrogenase family)